MLKKFLRFFWDNFIAGIVVILPITITIFVIRFLVIKLNKVMLNPVVLWLSPHILEEEQGLFLAKTIVFLAAIFIVVLIGLMTRVLIIRRTFSFFEKLLYKLPMVNKMYGAIKEISNAFLGKRKSGFKRVVLVEYPRKGIFTIGFVTSEAKSSLQESAGQDGLINIYVPTTPNPTSGMLVLFDKKDAIPLDLSVEEALKVVISAGTITPPRKQNTNSDNTKI
ncbi:MAG: DUF502 domain-containing protein [Candidatus Omnitrophica bacterium]|nr:DUF502 domain-containing protein [Candidatus Omnitrophota bacterium]